MVHSVTETTFAQEVLQSPQPVIVNFWAPWCGLCKMINPILFHLQSASDLPIKVVNINADENFKLANTYRIKSLPTILVFDRGNLIHKLDEFNGREGVRQSLQNIVFGSVARSV